ncbi:MAG: VPLPA-CTERM sorting domain-containing protein [Steroidobacteraceae bacterium]
MGNRRLRGIFWTAALAVMLAPAVHASSVTYYLNQSNVDSVYPDGTDYAKVVIEDVGSDIQFTVSILPGVFDPDSNFGIQQFGFNIISGGPSLNGGSNFSLPDGWGAGCGGQMDGFGIFDCTVDTTGNGRLDPLVFKVTGVTGDLLSTYFDLSTTQSGKPPGQGYQYFALHITGFKDPSGLPSNNDNATTSGFFGGGYQKTNVVPIPAAAWLLLSGVAGLGAMARRRRGVAETGAEAA